jgi:hypothetical protein
MECKVSFGGTGSERKIGSNFPFPPFSL